MLMLQNNNFSHALYPQLRLKYITDMSDGHHIICWTGVGNPEANPTLMSLRYIKGIEWCGVEWCETIGLELDIGIKE